LNLLQKRAEVIEQAGNAFLDESAQDADREVSFTDAATSHQQQTAINRRIFVG